MSGGVTVGGGAAVAVVMIADTMCMVIAIAERPVVEPRTVAAAMPAAEAVMVAVEASIEPRNRFKNQHRSIYIYEISKPIPTFFQPFEHRLVGRCLRVFAGGCASEYAGSGFEGSTRATAG
jgi:hypothetical protein